MKKRGKKMYKIEFKYTNGSKGTCTLNGGKIVFETKKEADDFAKKMNDNISDDLKEFFPTWYAVKC